MKNRAGLKTCFFISKRSEKCYNSRYKKTLAVYAKEKTKTWTQKN